MSFILAINQCMFICPLSFFKASTIRFSNEMSHLALTRLCKEYSLSTTGRKAELKAKLKVFSENMIQWKWYVIIYYVCQCRPSVLLSPRGQQNTGSAGGAFSCAGLHSHLLFYVYSLNCFYSLIPGAQRAQHGVRDGKIYHIRFYAPLTVTQI